jgi:hypothetical protein
MLEFPHTTIALILGAGGTPTPQEKLKKPGFLKQLGYRAYSLRSPIYASVTQHDIILNEEF